MRTIIWLIVLVALWAGITGDTSPAGLATGAVIAAVSVWFIRKRIGAAPSGFNPLHAAILVAIFVWELVLSAVKVAIQVLSPRMDMKPGIVAIPLSTDREFEISVLANMITLTPGTLSVDVSEDKTTLYVHALDVGDADELRRGTKRTFEQKIMKAFR